MSPPAITHEMLLREVQQLRHDVHARIDHLDVTLRGNNGDGLTVRVARLHERSDAHAQQIQRAFDHVQVLRGEVTRIDRRIVFFSGGAAAIGALCGVLIKPLVQHLL